jgi:hypothetical protein
VLVHVDLRRRDIMHSVWLKHWLEQLGAEVRLCSRVTLLREFERFRPHATILAHTNEFGLDHARLVDRARRSRLFVLPTEDATDDAAMYYESHEPDLQLAQAQPEEGWLYYFTHVYCWGPLNKQRLLEARLMREEQIVVSGNPRFDLDWDRLFSEPAAGKPIGIVGNFVDLNPWDFHTRPWPLMHGETKYPPYWSRQILDGPQYTFDVINDLRGGVGKIYPANRSAEDMLWASIAHFRLILDFLDHWTARGGQVILRPHTMERYQSYELLMAKYRPHLQINNDPGFFLFLQKVCGVLVMSSTSIIEALLAKRPIITFEPLLNGRYQEHVGSTPWKRLPYLDRLWRPDTMDALIETVRAAQAGQLTPCPDMAPFEVQLREHYDLPRSEPSTLTVAQDVMHCLECDGFEPPAVSPLKQLRDELDFDAYMAARRARQIAFAEHRYLDNLTHHLSLARREEEAMLQYMRRS